MRVRFGECTFDSETRELLRGDMTIHLSPKAYRLLEHLLENRPRALSKADIQEYIWPGVFVSEANVASLVSEIREAIGEKGRSARLLRTVYGFGYAFSGDVAETSGVLRPAASRRHSLFVKRREIRLAEGENIVGRDIAASVRIDDPTVSRRHARIVVAGAAVTVEDLGSKNGSFLDGEPVRGVETTRSGSILKFGSVESRLKTFSTDETTRTGRPDRGVV